MDIVGPLPCTTSGNRYILAFVDHLTRFTETFTLPDQKADTIAKAFVKGVVLRYGTPLQLLTDQGTNFTGKLMRECYRKALATASAVMSAIEMASAQREPVDRGQLVSLSESGWQWADDVHVNMIKAESGEEYSQSC
ncbi:hypothetical protein MRX96_057327 [Rhipicephalus microplus]